MCRLGITCNDIDNLKILNIPAHEVFTVKINKKQATLLLKLPAKMHL